MTHPCKFGCHGNKKLVTMMPTATAPKANKSKPTSVWGHKCDLPNFNIQGSMEVLSKEKSTITRCRVWE